MQENLLPDGDKVDEEFVVTDEKAGTGDGAQGEVVDGAKADGGDGDEDKIESLAKELGWRPKKSFRGVETDYVDAKSYIRRGQDIQNSMRRALKDQKHQLSDMSDSIAELKVHNKRVYKAEVAGLKNELATLKAEKKTAIEDGDVAKVDALDERISTVKESMVLPEPKSPREAANPEFDKWLEGNQWYDENKEMAQYADSIAAEHEGAPFQRIASLVEKRVKEIYPDKFAKPTQETIDNTSRVEGATRKRTAGKFTEADLSSSQKSIMQQFVRQGIMTKVDYIKDIATTQGA